MKHSFDVRIAEKYGILPAILLDNLDFWIAKNKANDVNFYEGRYWTYNSTKAFKELLPYASEKQIITALKKLENEGLIIVSNFNKSPYDRTKWYALSDRANNILKNGNIELPYKSNENIPKGEMKMTTRSNETDQMGEPIPDINTDINTDNNKKENIKEKETDYGHIKDMFNDICMSFPKVTVISEKRKKQIRARINAYGYEKIIEVFKKAEASDFLKGSNNRDWQANFDWLMKDSNFAKVLDGNYDKKTNRDTGQSTDKSELQGVYL